jgi:hypothetical protein
LPTFYQANGSPAHTVAGGELDPRGGIAANRPNIIVRKFCSVVANAARNLFGMCVGAVSIAACLQESSGPYSTHRRSLGYRMRDHLHHVNRRKWTDRPTGGTVVLGQTPTFFTPMVTLAFAAGAAWVAWQAMKPRRKRG